MKNLTKAFNSKQKLKKKIKIKNLKYQIVQTLQTCNKIKISIKTP